MAYRRDCVNTALMAARYWNSSCQLRALQNCIRTHGSHSRRLVNCDRGINYKTEHTLQDSNLIKNARQGDPLWPLLRLYSPFRSKISQMGRASYRKPELDA